MRQSAGMRSPTWTEMISPGTRSEAGIRVRRDERRTSASSGEYSLSAYSQRDRMYYTHIDSLFGVRLLHDSHRRVGNENEQNDQRLDKRSQP